MNLSDTSDEGSSNEESRTTVKCTRTNTYEASATVSQESQPADNKMIEEMVNNHQLKRRKTEMENGTLIDIRLNSRSSNSKNCSSPSEQLDDYCPSYHDSDDQDDTFRPSFQNLNSMTKPTDDMNNGYTYNGEYSEKSKRMMSNMGYKPGKGLGKFEHGRIEPVEASNQKGRRGLGLKPSVLGSIPEDFKWTPDESKPEAAEEVIWMSPAPDEPLFGDQLEEWLKKGSKKMIIDDETDFVEPNILKGVLKAKTIFDELDDEDLRHARFRANPYETIGSGIFLNRAAVKMANIDAICDFMFSNPKKQCGEDLIDKKDILFFADVCAGPGGFSEYILYRRGWRAKGFGFTLKGPNDFKLSDFYVGPPESFHPYYGAKNDGNIFDPSNLTSLKEHVLQQTEDKGVHFLMADGGFSVEGQENIQEILSKQLYLCQCLAALMLVRTGGHFVVKLFDVFTRFSIGLIYIMYRCFDKVCIHKPVTSRPANSERYLICLWKKPGTESAERHLYTVNSILWNGTNTELDVLELVPIEVIHEDAEFFEYVYKSNCLIGERQIKHLLKIAAFSKHKILKEIYQAEMKEQCLRLWNLPDQVRTQPKRMSPDETLKSILSLLKPPSPQVPFNFKTNILNKKPEYLEGAGDLSNFNNVYDWHFVFLSSGRNCPDLKIFIGCGGKQVFQLESNGWKSVLDLQITLPAKTLVYGEIVKEYRGQGNNQMYSKSLHIIDALMLGGVDVSQYPLNERINQCNIFCTALSKPFDAHVLQVRCKKIFSMEQFPSVVNNLQYRAMKRVKRAVTIEAPDTLHRNDMFYVVGSVLFMKEIKEPWSTQLSKKSGLKYYFSIGKDRKPRSEYYILEEARLDMTETYSCRVMWPWEGAASAILDGQQHAGVTRAQLEEYITHNIER